MLKQKVNFCLAYQKSKNMRTIFSICLCLIFLSCTHISTGGAEKSFRDLTEASKK